MDFAQQLRRKNAEVPDIYFTLLYFTLLDAAGIAPTQVLNQNAKAKEREEAGSLSESDCQQLQRLYTQGDAAYGSVSNLVKASNLSVSKVRQFLHSKPSYTKFTFARRDFMRMKAFARFKYEIWCMDLGYVDKLAKDINGVRFFSGSSRLVW